jgi:hypothetical protein
VIHAPKEQVHAHRGGSDGPCLHGSPGSPCAGSRNACARSPADRLTLEQAKELALTNNKQLQLGQLNVQEKQIAVSAAKRDYFPKVLGLASYLHFDEPLVVRHSLIFG